jgi:hypothetical protein
MDAAWYFILRQMFSAKTKNLFFRRALSRIDHSHRQLCRLQCAAQLGCIPANGYYDNRQIWRAKSAVISPL